MNKISKILLITVIAIICALPCYAASKQDVKAQKKADASSSLPAGKYDGKDSYIITGTAEKDGPGYKITTKDGKTINLTSTAKTELHPYWIKPEKMAKLIIKYVNNDGLRQAVQIYDAKNGYVDRKVINGVVVYSIEKNEDKTR